jgi:Clathrin-H-link
LFVADADVDELSQSYPDVDDDVDSRSVEEEQDADTILDYIEQFNELMEDKRYSEAALHAANGPRGVLRTHETMQRFAGEYT